MEYLSFRQQFFDAGIFTVGQVNAVMKPFDKNNLGRWTKRGLLVRLKNGMYAFPEWLQRPGFGMFAANKMYKPSYISLHSALAFYDMIPETVVQLTSVTSLKTWDTENAAGQFSYRNVHPRMMFGYDIKAADAQLSGQAGLPPIFIATPEKALLDLLYLNREYKSEEDMEELRLDDDFMASEFSRERMDEYLDRLADTSLTKRMNTLYKVYDV